MYSLVLQKLLKNLKNYNRLAKHQRQKKTQQIINLISIHLYSSPIIQYVQVKGKTTSIETVCMRR